jgi:hypothetical protein
MSERSGPYEKRYGNIAIEKGFITPEQLMEALNIQVMEEINDGNHRLLGVILFEKKFITLIQDKEVLDALAILLLK